MNKQAKLKRSCGCKLCTLLKMLTWVHCLCRLCVCYLCRFWQ